MKKIFFLLVIFLIFACSSDNEQSRSKSIVKKTDPNANRLDRYSHYEVTIFARPDITAKKVSKLSKGQNVKIDSIGDLFCSVHNDSTGDLLGYAPVLFLHPEPMINGVIIFNRARRYVHQKVNIYSGRGTNYKIVDSFIRGSAAIVDSLKDGWYGTFDVNDNLMGYVHEKLIKEEPLPAFEIVDWNWRKSSNYVIYNVQIRNNTRSYVRNVQVEFTTYDKNDRLIETDYTFVTGLQPNGTASAKGYATKFGNEQGAKIRIVK